MCSHAALSAHQAVGAVKKASATARFPNGRVSASDRDRSAAGRSRPLGSMASKPPHRVRRRCCTVARVPAIRPSGKAAALARMRGGRRGGSALPRSAISARTCAFTSSMPSTAAPAVHPGPGRRTRQAARRTSCRRREISRVSMGRAVELWPEGARSGSGAAVAMVKGIDDRARTRARGSLFIVMASGARRKPYTELARY